MWLVPVLSLAEAKSSSSLSDGLQKLGVIMGTGTIQYSSSTEKPLYLPRKSITLFT